MGASACDCLDANISQEERSLLGRVDLHAMMPCLVALQVSMHVDVKEETFARFLELWGPELL